MGGQRAPDRLVAGIAARQGGVVSFDGLLALGLTPRQIDRRVELGRLHRLHHGVYAVGHRNLGVEGRRWAAVLALGVHAFLSHDSAADAFGMRASASGLIHVTVRGRAGRRPRKEIRVHRPRALPNDEITTLRGLPITTQARTILDLAAAGLRDRPLENVLNAADLVCHLDFAELHRLLARYPRRPGTGSLKAQLARYRGPADTRSKLERLVNELCDDRGLPRPFVNTVIEGRVRDFYWPHCGLVVEADSYRWHRSPSALNDDRERDVELTLAGYRVLRFTYEQVTRRPDYVVRAIRVALGTR
jgi:very-short-patch-repair endonuclease/predicted transcriptional regulator of viral defense system